MRRVIAGIGGALLLVGGVFYAILRWPFGPTGSIFMFVVSCFIVVIGFVLIRYAIRGTP